VALVILPTIQYHSGQILDMKRLTEEAHKHGILIVFDGCHSVVAIPHAFSEWDVEFSYWSNYKYLNGGPGSVGGMYVNRKYLMRIQVWLAGLAPERISNLILSIPLRLRKPPEPIKTAHRMC
jgi:kynureninase